MSTMGQGGRGHTQVRGEERTGRRRKWRAERDVRCEVWGLLSFCQVSLPPPDGVSRCETHRPSLAHGDQEMSGEIIDFVCELSSVSAQLGVYHILMITGIGLWLVSSTLPLTDYWMRTCYCLLVAGGHRVISLSPVCKIETFLTLIVLQIVQLTSVTPGGRKQPESEGVRWGLQVDHGLSWFTGWRGHLPDWSLSTSPLPDFFFFLWSHKTYI